MQADVMNERFTIYLNSRGDPVQRRLSDMTPDEVMEAIIWNGKGCPADRELRPTRTWNRAARRSGLLAISPIPATKLTGP
jgi:hypothetical protein